MLAHLEDESHKHQLLALHYRTVNNVRTWVLFLLSQMSNTSWIDTINSMYQLCPLAPSLNNQLELKKPSTSQLPFYLPTKLLSSHQDISLSTHHSYVNSISYLKSTYTHNSKSICHTKPLSIPTSSTRLRLQIIIHTPNHQFHRTNHHLSFIYSLIHQLFTI